MSECIIGSAKRHQDNDAPSASEQCTRSRFAFSEMSTTTSPMKITVSLLVLLLGAPVFAVPISISVIDEKGAPIAGADVQFEPVVKAPREIMLQKTGVDGRVTLDVEPPNRSIYGDYIGRLAAFKSGFALGVSRLNFKKTAPVVLLPLGAPITGVVVDGNKKPLAGAKVSLFHWRRGTSYNSFHGLSFSKGPLGAQTQTTTDAQGKWTLNTLPPDVTATVSILAPGFARTRTEVASGTSVQSALHAGAQVQGRLLGLDGKPLPDVRVYAQPTNDGGGNYQGYGEGVTSPDGTFELEGLDAGTYNVMFQFDKDDAPFVVAAVEGVSASVGAPVKLPDSRAETGVLIGGKVSSRGTAKGIEGVQIGIYGGANPASSGSVASATTDKNGAWTKRIVPGASKIYVMGTPQEWVREEAMRDVEIKKNGQSDLNFQLAPATKITGRLVDENGRGVKTSLLVLRQKNDEFSIASDDNGDFETFIPTNGEAEIGHSNWNRDEDKDAAKWDVVGTSKVSVSEAKPLEIKLRRAELATLEMGVFDENDAPVEGAKVTVNLISGEGNGRTWQPTNLVSDKAGLVHLDGIRADQNISLDSATKDGFDAAPFPKIEKQNGVYRADITLNRRSGKASGEVFDAKGQPAKDALVFASGVETKSDETGRFALAALPQGESEVFVWKDEGFALGSNTQTRFDLKPQTLEPTNLARAAQILAALIEASKTTQYSERDSLKLEAQDGDFEASAARVVAANLTGRDQLMAIYRLVVRWGKSPDVAPEKWFALFQTVPKPDDRLMLVAQWITKPPVLESSAAARAFLASLQETVALAQKAKDPNAKWSLLGQLFGVAAFAERIGETEMADTFFEQGDAMVLENFPEKSASPNSPSQNEVLSSIAEIVAVSPRLLGKLETIIESDSPSFARLMQGGAPIVARLAGIEAARPFLERLQNAPTPKADEHNRTYNISSSSSQAILESIIMGGKSNPKTALELAQSLPKISAVLGQNWRAEALSEAAFFQSPEVAANLWRESLPQVEAGVAMKFVARIKATDEPLARSLYQTVRASFDILQEGAANAPDSNAGISTRETQIPAFAFYEAQFDAARARYRLERGFQQAQKSPEARLLSGDYARAMALFDVNRALLWADKIGNKDNNFAGFEAKRRIAQFLSLDEAAQRKTGFGNRFGRYEEEN